MRHRRIPISRRCSRQVPTKLSHWPKSSTTIILITDIRAASPSTGIPSGRLLADFRKNRVSSQQGGAPCPRAFLNLRTGNQGSTASLTGKIKGMGQTEFRSSFSGEQRRTLPRRFWRARFRRHSPNKRLAVNRGIFAALASSSFVASNSRPPVTFCPMKLGQADQNPSGLLRAE